MKTMLITLLTVMLAIPLLSDYSPNVKGATGLFEMNYPFTLPPGQSGYVFSVDTFDTTHFFLGLGWGVFKRLEFNFNLSYYRAGLVDSMTDNTGAGYASLALKHNFLKSKKTGLGLNIYWDIPLSCEKHGVTGVAQRYGIDLLLGHAFSPRTIFSVNLGHRFNRASKQWPFDPGDSIHFGAGIETGVTRHISAAVQCTGTLYHGNDYPQTEPLDMSVGLKYEKKNRYGNTYAGVSLAFKKNLTFHRNTMRNAQGAVGSLWFYIGEKNNSCVLPEGRLTGVTIAGADSASAGAIENYKAQMVPLTAVDVEFNPVFFTWQCSANGIISGQGGPVIDITWQAALPNEPSWVKVSVSNKCSAVAATKTITLVSDANEKEDSR